MPRDDEYQPQNFWEARLRNDFSLRGVGHIGFSESYNRWLYRRKATVIKNILAGIDLKGIQVLDIGCGTGFFVTWYSTRRALVSGLDITEVSVRKLTQKFPHCAFRVQDITDSSYVADTSFDVINMWDVVYHIVDDSALARALDNVVESLKPGGLFLFTDWFGAAKDLQIAPHVKGRTLDTHSKLLAARGVDLVRAVPLYGMLNRPHCRIDNHLGWLYYSLDRFGNHMSTGNLSVGLWRKRDR